MPYFYDILHKHPEIQITYIEKSHGTLILTDFMADFQPGDLFIIGPNQPHMFKNDKQYYGNHQDLEAYGISFFFDQSVFGSTFLSLPENKRLSAFVNRCDGNMSLKKGYTADVQCMINNLFSQKGHLKLLRLLEILYHLSGHKSIKYLTASTHHKYDNEVEGERMNKILDFTTNHYQNNITLENVASLASLTTTSFCRYFKKRTRKSYVDFLSEVRIRQACKMLQDSDEPVAQICFKTGFNNLSNFNRKFKRITSISPTAYRKMSEGNI